MERTQTPRKRRVYDLLEAVGYAARHDRIVVAVTDRGVEVVSLPAAAPGRPPAHLHEPDHKS
jgi:hypothetical protein